MNTKTRIRVAGIYVHNEKLLLVKHRRGAKEYYLLPGGGHEQNETFIDTLKREWYEELNLTIEPGEMLFIGESLPPTNSAKNHVVQVVFEIKKIEGTIMVSPDGTLFDAEYLPLAELKNRIFYPDCTGQIHDYLNHNKVHTYMTYRWIQ